MHLITAHETEWELWYLVWHGHNLENSSQVFETTVTTQDYEMMKDIKTDYYKTKVHKLLDQRPFDTNN